MSDWTLPFLWIANGLLALLYLLFDQEIRKVEP